MSQKQSQLVFAAPRLVTVPVFGQLNVFAVRRIYCVGRNYVDHIREMGGDEREPPFFFQKPTDSIILDGGSIAYPSMTNDFQYEVELVLAIGVGGVNISQEKAVEHVYGVAVGIDLTRRDVQVVARKSGRPWEIGKSFDHSAPCGAIHPLMGKPLPRSGCIELKVNQNPKQRADLGQMIWSADEIVSKLSEQYRLECGDLIYTGTPAGVGPLLPGDRIHAHIDAIGDLKISIAS